MAQIFFPGVFVSLITGTKMYGNYKDKTTGDEKRKAALAERQNSMSGDSPSHANDHLKKRGYMIAETISANGKLSMVSEEYLEKHLKTNSALAGYRDHIRSKFSESRPRLDSTLSSASTATLDSSTPLAKSTL